MAPCPRPSPTPRLVVASTLLLGEKRRHHLAAEERFQPTADVPLEHAVLLGRLDHRGREARDVSDQVVAGDAEFGYHGRDIVLAVRVEEDIDANVDQLAGELGI